MGAAGRRTFSRYRPFMIFPYRQYEVEPTPGRSEDFIFRPVVPVRVRGPRGAQVILGLVDTGADVTVLPSFLLPLIGADDLDAELAQFSGVGGQKVTVRYSHVNLSLEHPDGSHQWSAKIGFLDGHDVA